MVRRLLVPVLASLLLSACSVGSNWHLMDSGYSIDAREHDEFAIEVHYNQLQQLGGEIRSAEFHLFVSERLKWHGLCERGWQPLPCVADGSCVQSTRRSVTVAGRCVR
jgi:hypothetical protein